MTPRQRSLPRDRQRGNVAMLMAIMLPIFIGFMALVVDLGHGWQVRNQQQNAADSAALAGVRDLDGTSTVFNSAIASARYYGALNDADNRKVSLAAANVVLGNWNFITHSFTPYGGAMAPYKVNAVQVNAPTLPVATWFAPLLGVTTENVQTSAIAVGGSPDATCAAPLAVPECSIIDGNGQIRCNSTLTFAQATSDNVGFTTLSSSTPVNTQTVECLFATMLGASPCPKNCGCAGKCNSTQTSTTVNIGNGNNLSQNDVSWLNSAIAASPNGLYFDVAVLGSSPYTASNCGSFQFSGTATVVGYVSMKLTAATNQPNRSISATVDCTRSGPASPSGTGGFYGYKSTNVYLVK
jgi:hypothetical protein